MRKALYILAGLEDQDLLWFVNNGTYQNIAAGTKLITANEPVDMLYIIIDGKLNVVLPSHKKIASIGSGDVLGEMSLIENNTPSVSVVSVSDAKILIIPHTVIHRHLENDSGFAARFYRALAVF